MKKSTLSMLMVGSLALNAGILPMIGAADEVDSAIQQKDEKIDSLKSQEADTQKQLDAVQSQVDSINASAEKLLKEQEELRAASAKLSEEIDELNVRIEKREEAIQNQARDVQVNGQSTTYIDAVLNSNSISDAVTRVAAVNTIITANNDLVKQQQLDKEAVETKKAENEEKQVTLQANQADLEAQKGDLVKAQLDLAVLQADLSAQRATAEDEKASYLKQKEEAEAERKLAEQQEKASQEQAQAAAASSNSSASTTTTSDNNNSASSETPVAEQPATSGSTDNGNTAVEQPSTPAPSTPAPEVPQPTGGSAVSIAAAQIGKPYVWGSKGPNSFDCSGLVYYSFMQAYGRNVGGYTVAQESAGTRISVAEAQAGDLYFWGSPGGSYHVAIATGGGGYIHAATPEIGVVSGSVSSFTPDFAVRM